MGFRVGLGFPTIRATFLGGSLYKDYGLLGFMLGPPILGKYPRTPITLQRSK